MTKSQFGENFKNYMEKEFSKQKLKQAKDSLSSFYKMDSFRGKSFLDIGCGSGIFSLSALQLGANSVVSFDIDQNSLKCARDLQSYNDTTIQRYNDTTIQRYNDTTIQRYNDTTIQRYNDTTIQRYNDTTIQRYNDTTIQRYNDTTIQRYNDTTIQRYNDTTIQRYNDTTIQRYSQDALNHWAIQYGNILDKDYIQNLGQFDLVYCWGVVHHSGEMWQAIENTLLTVKPGGYLYFGIYNEADNFGFYPDRRFGTSRFWEKVKKLFYYCPTWLQKFVEWAAIAAIFLIYMMSFTNPIRKLKEHGERGMTWKTDIKDWLIGYPYEYTDPDRVINYMIDKGFVLKNIKTNNGLLTNHFLFQKTKELVRHP